jgi:hypothetical protein
MDYSKIPMQSYYIQHPPIYPNYALPQRPVVSSNDPVKRDIDCIKADEKVAKQDLKYLQPKWCPSDFSHLETKTATNAQKEFTKQQVEDVQARSATIKQVCRPKQVVSSSA